MKQTVLGKLLPMGWSAIKPGQLKAAHRIVLKYLILFVPHAIFIGELRIFRQTRDVFSSRKWPGTLLHY
jgi:hypothetical protein